MADNLVGFSVQGLIRILAVLAFGLLITACVVVFSVFVSSFVFGPWAMTLGIVGGLAVGAPLGFVGTWYAMLRLVAVSDRESLIAMLSRKYKNAQKNRNKQKKR